MNTARFHMVIEWGKIQEFARASMSEQPAYRTPLAVVPVTFLSVADWTWGPMQEWRLELFREIGFGLDRILHAEQEYVFHAAIPRVGDELTGEISLHELYERTNGAGKTLRFATIRTAFRDRDDRLIADQFTTTVERPPI